MANVQSYLYIVGRNSKHTVIFLTNLKILVFLDISVFETTAIIKNCTFTVFFLAAFASFIGSLMRF